MAERYGPAMRFWLSFRRSHMRGWGAFESVNAKERRMMSKAISIALSAGLLCALVSPASAADEGQQIISLRTFPTYWVQNRTAQDDFLQPLEGPGPVQGPPGHHYIPNGAGAQQTNRLADLTNPILKPWVIEQMQKTNDAVNAGKIPFIARERCWTTGVPGWDVFAHAAGMWVVQTEKVIYLIQELDQQVRR